MLLKRKVGARGQVVLPKDIREQLGLKEGTEVTFETSDDQIIIKPAKTPEQWAEEFCRTSRKIKVKDGVKWFKKVLDEQHEEEYGIH